MPPPETERAVQAAIKGMVVRCVWYGNVAVGGRLRVVWHMRITSCRACGDVYVAHVLEGDAIIGRQIVKQGRQATTIG